MKEDIISLKKEFIRIKKMGLIKSLRNGSTGLGYTFEALLNKEEDQECKPDYGTIELKCKLGYTKAPISLFSCAPKKDNNPAIKYIFDNYSYHRYGNLNDIKIFAARVYSKFAINIYGYQFKSFVDYYKQQITLKAYYNERFLEDICYWSFDVLKEKLIKKLSILAIIYGYPYYRSGIKYYRYLKMNIYKLKNFNKFLELIESDKIYINFYLKLDERSIVKDHGVVFKIKKDDISELFDEIK